MQAFSRGEFKVLLKVYERWTNSYQLESKFSGNVGSNELLQLGLLQLADHQFNGAFFVTKIHALERFQYSKFWKKKIIGNSLILKFSKSLKFLEIKISLKI